MFSVLVSTWGEPRLWENVTYIMEGQRYNVPTKTSLPVILENANPKPEKVFLIVLDTVVKQPVSSYKDLKDFVATYYQEFLRSLNLGTEIPVDIIVAPGVGRFRLDDGSLVEFHGFLTDYLAYTTFEISRRLLQTRENELTVHLDLTHGINFLPSLTYALISEVLGAVAIAKKVQLKVYNSEPYIRGVTSELNIHKVEDRQIMPNIRNEALSSDSRLLDVGAIQEKEKVEIKNILYGSKLNEKDVNELNAFLSSLVNGLPLAYYAFYPDVNSLELLLNNAEKLWDSQIMVNQIHTDVVYTGPNQRSSEARLVTKKLIVERKARFTSEFTKCAIIWTVAKAQNHKRKSEVRLSELKSLQQRMFSRWTKLNSMISYDLEEVERNVEKWRGPLDDWKRLGDITGEFYDQARGDKFARNFLAHSGLEKSLTYVKRQHNEIWLRYNLNSQHERRTILGACLRGLYKSAT